MIDRDEVILNVKDLRVYFYLDEGLLKAVDGVDFSLTRTRTLGLVGESGCGKSVTAQAILGIVPNPGQVQGEVWLQGQNGAPPVNLTTLDPVGAEIRAIRGAEIAMIFQEPGKAFSPVHTVGNQIMEGILLHTTDSKQQARQTTLDVLDRVQMANPSQNIDAYPHQLSGGMRQRAMIAMALSCQPSILIADEPTTAVDVTVQAQVLQLMKELQADLGMSLIFITHDLGVIAEMADEVAVMYLGKVVEFADVDTIFHGPQHPYTVELLRSLPEVGREPRTRLLTIEGTVPVPINLPKGCGFYSRCRQGIAGQCDAEDPPLIEVEDGHYIRCFR